LRLVLLASHKLETPWAQFVRLLVYTAARRSEVARAPWSEFSGLERSTDANNHAPAFWEIPGARTKNGRIHILPLPEGATEMLLQMPRIGEKGFVFTVTGRTPIVGFSDAKEHLDAAMLAIAREEATAAGEDADKVAIAPWRWHDIRRTVATGMAAKKIAPHVIEAVLNHASGVLSGVAGVYNRYAYADEKAAALGVWAEHVAALETGAEAMPDETNIIRLRA
jgi:integrase